jgi:hypothetical protein
LHTVLNVEKKFCSCHKIRKLGTTLFISKVSNRTHYTIYTRFLKGKRNTMICETRSVFVRLKMSPQSENLLLCLPELYIFACFVTVLVHLTWIRKYRYCTAGLWIRIDSMRIWFRIQAKTELSKTISFSNFFEIKI